ncbi:RING finger protein 34 [Mactra antiquata]
MGAGIVKPDQHGFRIHIHAGNRSNQRMDQQPGLKCEECSSKLTASRKISCKDCERLFCVPCSMQPLQQCKKCSIVLSGNFSRAQLKEWKPRDLKAILQKHNVNTSICREKDELIDLIFSYFGCNINRTNTQASGAGDDLLNNSRHDNETNQSSPRQNTSQNLPNVDTQSTTVNNEPTQQSEDQSNQDTSNVNQSGLNDTNNDEITSPRNEINHIKLEDVKSEEHIEQLSIKCLKRLLLNNFVDYKGCCERWELQDRVKRLWKDDQKNKQKAEEMRKISENPSLVTSEMSSNNEDEICKICMDATIDCVLLECGHMVTCTSCGKRLSECPICRQFVVRSVHIFKA